MPLVAVSFGALASLLGVAAVGMIAAPPRSVVIARRMTTPRDLRLLRGG